MCLGGSLIPPAVVLSHPPSGGAVVCGCHPHVCFFSLWRGRDDVEWAFVVECDDAAQ